MSQQRNQLSGTPKLELMLNLEVPPPRQQRADSPGPDSPSSTTDESSSSSSEMSIDGSCVSSEAEQECLSSSAVAVPMVLVGCPRCLMYVMLSDSNPKCPKCKSTVLLDFLNEENNKNTST